MEMPRTDCKAVFPVLWAMMDFVSGEVNFRGYIVARLLVFGIAAIICLDIESVELFVDGLRRE